MAFPDDPLCPAVELFYDGVWNAVVDDVNASDDVVIKRGRSDWSDTADPARCSLIFNNQDGKYSPRNPRSPLFGKIGRNTPVRVRVGDNDASLHLPGVSGAYASTPDTAVLDLTGDMDVRVELEPDTWRPASFEALMSKYAFNQAANQRSWALLLLHTGQLEYSWSPDGTGTNRVVLKSTDTVSEDSGRLAVRATLDADDGAGNHVVTFYTATSISGPWTVLGAPIVTAGTATLHSSDIELAVGAWDIGVAAPYSGRIFSCELYNGIDGVLVASPNFTALDAGVRSFSDSAGLPWALHDTAVMEDRSVRFAGEVSAWPPRWNSELDVQVPITASGIRRRLSQGASPLSSALYRGITGGNVTAPVAYWPCEDGKNATEFGSALGHDPMKFVGDASKIKPASFDDAASSLPIPVVSTGGRFDGTVPEYPASDFARGMILIDIPAAGVPVESTAIRMRTIGGTTESWFLNILPNGSYRLLCFAHGGATLVDQVVGSALNGTTGLIWIYLIQNGADIDWQIGRASLAKTTINFFSGTLVGHSFGRVHQMIVGQNKDLDGVAVGHVHVLHTEEFWDIVQFAKAWNGDTVQQRIARLSAEENVPVALTSGDSAVTGPQRPLTYLDLVDEAADADMGILVDRRDALGLYYRARESVYSQVPALTLDYSTGEVAAPFEPVEDDQALRNDVTVNREDGASVRLVETGGPLSVLPPPLGVGRYDESITINVEDDGQLRGQAGWRLHLGTVDEARYPTVTVDLFANPHLIDAAKLVDVGDLIRITNPPPWLAPGNIDLIVQGYTEVLNALKWEITFNCSPGSPWNVWVLEDEKYSRLDTTYSETAATFVSGTDTQLTVASGRFEGFEDNNLLPTVGNTWERTTTHAHAGTWSLYSGVVGAGGSSDAAFSVPEGQQTFQFWYRVSSESGFDFFRFFVDGVETLSASGEVPWTQSPTFDVSTASTITFRYVKDGSINGGEDAAWIDDLSFQQGVEWETDPALNQVPFDITVSGVRLRVTSIGNLLTNPGFETDTSGWTVARGTLTRDTTQAHTGTASGRYDSDTSVTGLRYIRTTDLFPVTDSLVVSAWVRAGAGFTEALARIEWRDAAGTFLSTSSGTAVALSSTWQQVTVTDGPPAGAATATARVEFSPDPGATAAHAYVDDVSLSDVAQTSPQTFIVEQAPINGVEKTIPAGESVQLTHPAIVAL
jgi:hypothetical protein